MGFLNKLKKSITEDIKSAASFTSKKANDGFDFLGDIVSRPNYGSGFNKTLDILDYTSKVGTGAFSQFGDLEYDSKDQRLERRFTPGSIGRQTLRTVGLGTGIIGQSRKERDAEEDAIYRRYGQKAPKGLNQRLMQGAREWDESNLPGWAKTTGDFVFDPSMYIPAGTIGKLSTRAGIAGTRFGKLALGSEKAGASSRSARILGGLLEGAGAKGTLAIGAGSAAGQAVSGITDNTYDDFAFQLAGGVLGGAGLHLSQAKASARKQNVIEDNSGLVFRDVAKHIEEQGNQLPRVAPGQQWKQVLKSKGITDREMEWNGLDEEFFSKGKVSREEVLNRIKENDFDIEETILGPSGFNRWHDDPEIDTSGHNQTIYENYTVPGGESGTYREILLRQKPGQEDGIDPMSWSKPTTGDAESLRWVHNYNREPLLVSADGKFSIMKDANYEEYYLVKSTGFNQGDWNIIKSFTDENRALLAGLIEAIDYAATMNTGKTYNNQWDYQQANRGKDILAHIRVDDRDGGRTLFVHEIQSDWAQENRTGNKVHVTHKNTPTDNWPHPFQNNWQELSIKRILRYAADNGYDKVKFASGEETLKIPGMRLPEQLEVDGKMTYPAEGRRTSYNQIIPNKAKDIAKKFGLTVEKEDTTRGQYVHKFSGDDSFTPHEVEFALNHAFEEEHSAGSLPNSRRTILLENSQKIREIAIMMNDEGISLGDALAKMAQAGELGVAEDIGYAFGLKYEMVPAENYVNAVINLTPEARAAITSKPQTMFSVVGDGQAKDDPNAIKRMERQARLQQMAEGGDPRNAPPPYMPTIQSERDMMQQGIEQGKVPMNPKAGDRVSEVLSRTGEPYRDPREVPIDNPIPRSDVISKLKARYQPGLQNDPIPNIPITEMPTLRQHLQELVWGRPDETGQEKAAVRIGGGKKALGEQARDKFTLGEFERPKAPPIGDYELRAADLLETLSDEDLNMPVSTLEVADLIASIVGGRDMEKILTQRALEAKAYRDSLGNNAATMPVAGPASYLGHVDSAPSVPHTQIQTTEQEMAAIEQITNTITPGGAPPTPGNPHIDFRNPDEMRASLKYISDIRGLGDEAENVKTWNRNNVITKALAPLMSLVNPSVLMNTQVGRLITARTRQELSVQDLSTAPLAVFDKMSGFGGIRPAVGRGGIVFNTNKMGIVKGLNMHWNDVFSDLENLRSQLTPEQYAYAKAYNDMIDDIRTLRTIHVLPNLPREHNGKLWVPRVVKGIDNIEIINRTNHKAKRWYNLAMEGAQNGVNYADPRETLKLYLRETYNDIIKQDFANEMKKITDPVEDLVNPAVKTRLEESTAAFKSAKTDMKFAAEQFRKDKTNPDLQKIMIDAKERTKQAYIAKLKAETGMETALEAVTSQEANRSYRILPDGTKQPIATFPIAKLGNRVFDREDAELLRNYIGITGLGLKEVNESPASKALGATGRVFRTLTSTLDVATPFIHNLPLMTENPKAWTKAIAGNYAALVNPRVRDTYVANNLKFINEMAAYGIPVGSNEYFEALGREGEFTKFFDKTLGDGKTRSAVRNTGKQTVGRFEAAMSTNLLIARTELWKSNYAKYAKENNLDGLAQFVRNISGALDSKTLMVGKGQRDQESFWLAFSPKLVRSIFSLGAMASNPTTQEGRHAMRSLGIFMGATLGTAYLANLAMNPDIDPASKEALAPIDPTEGKRFMATKTPIGYIGVGGQIRAAMQLFGRSGNALWNREPGVFLQMDQFDNPIMNWYSGRGAPGIQFGQDIVEATTGANTNPYADISSPSDFFKTEAVNFLPFFAQNMLEAEDMKSGALQAGIGSFGPRFAPFSESERRNNRVQSMGFMKSDGSPAETIDDLNREQKNQFYEKFPVAKIDPKNDNVTKMFNLIDDEEVKFQADVAQMSLNVQRGKMSKEQFRNWYNDRNSEKFDRIDSIKGTFSVMPADRAGFKGSVTEYLDSKNTRPEDRAVAEWYAVSSKTPLKADGSVDFDAINKAKMNLLKSLPENQRAYVLKMTTKESQRAENELVTEYDIVKDITKSYFESDDRVFEYMKQNGSGFFGQFANYEAYQNYVQQTAMESGISPDTLSAYLAKKIPDVKAFDKARSEYKRLQRLADPNMDRALAEWYGVEPANKFDFVLSNFGSDEGTALSPAIAADKSLNNGTRATELGLRLRQSQPNTFGKRKFYRPVRSQI